MSTAPPTAIELTLKTGEVIKAPSYEEALKIAVGMAENTKDVYKEEKAKREALEARVASMEQAARPKPVAQEGQFDNDKYYRLLNESPVSAANYVDSFRFGIPDPNEVPRVFQTIQRDVSVTRQESMAAQFMQQHSKDFPANPESASALRKQTESLMAQGHPMSVDLLNLAYMQAVESGQIKPLEEKSAQTREEPNPSLSGGGAAGIVDVAEEQKVASMSDKELEGYLRQKGML